jgi:hypothetical protein
LWKLPFAKRKHAQNFNKEIHLELPPDGTHEWQTVAHLPHTSNHTYCPNKSLFRPDCNHRQGSIIAYTLALRIYETTTFVSATEPFQKKNKKIPD